MFRCNLPPALLAFCESSYRSTYNTSAICSATSQTSRTRLSVWHAGLWQVLRRFNMEEGLVQAIQALYENSSSAVPLNIQLEEFLNTTVGVCQGCLLSPIMFNLFPEKIMWKTLHNHHRSISIGGRPIATYDSPMMSTSWAAAMVNFKTSLTDS